MAETTPSVAGSNDNAIPAHGEWDTMLAHLNWIEAMPAEEVTEDEIDLAGALVGALMAMPAPHNAALVWKLDYLLASEGDHCTGCYSPNFISQTVVDYRRMVGGRAA